MTTANEVRSTIRTCLALGAAALAAPAHAGDIGHYNPGVLNIRDLVVPAEAGIYGALYQYYYTTDRLNDADGKKIRTINVNPGPGPGVNVDVDVDVDLYALVPTLIWVSDWKLLGANYAAYVAPTFANSSMNAHLATQNTLGRSAESDSFGVGDLMIQPLWLGWNRTHLSAALGYGFYAPTGKYDTDPVALPLPMPLTVRVESPDNIGYGFWTHQFQGAGAWYPWEDKRMAIVLAGTYEVNLEKKDYNLSPGDVLSLNWGVSQYLPVRKDQSLLAELGLAGYDSWQISKDSGSDATSTVEDEVHAVGGQLGLTHVPWGAVLNFHYFYEYSSDARFEGHAIGLSIVKKLTN